MLLSVYCLFRTLLFHGLESDWLEDECDDEVFRKEIALLFYKLREQHSERYFLPAEPIHHFFYRHKDICLDRKDVLEQKINQVLESVGYPSRGFVFTVRTSFDFFYIHYQEHLDNSSVG